MGGRGDLRNHNERSGPVGRLVAAVLAERADLSGRRIHMPLQGQQAAVVFIGDEVFKAPACDALIPTLKREICILTHLRGRMSAPIPAITYVGQKAHFYGMKKMTGTRLSRKLAASLSPAEREDLAFDLAQFMLEMSSAFVGNDIEPLALRTYYLSPPVKALADCISDPEVRAVLGNGLLGMAEMVALKLSSVPPPYGGRGVVCHGDLLDENLLFDTRRRRLSGILDFSLTGICPPEFDVLKLGNMPKILLDSLAYNYQAGGGEPIDVGLAVALRCAIRICDLPLQINNQTLKPYLDQALTELHHLRDDYERL